jgi:hypothetical protein
MTQSPESGTVLCGLACLACGITTTILALLGVSAWPLLLGLTLLMLLFMLRSEQISNKHHWAIHQGIDLLTLVSFWIGALGMVASIAFLIFGNPAGIVWVFIANGILVGIGIFLAWLFYPDFLEIGTI